MTNRIQIAVLSILVLLTVWSTNAQRGVVSDVSVLSERLSLLEARAADGVGLTKGPAGRREGREGHGKGLGRRMGAKAKAHLEAQAEAESGDTGTKATPAAELTEIKDALRDELVGMVAEEQEVASEERRNERRAKWIDGMRQSVEEFAADRELDEEVAQQIQSIVDAGMEEGMKLHEEMKNEDISYYEFRKEMKANREVFESDLSGVVSGEDYDELMELFPGRH
jgi:hypothetical protein